MMKSKPREEDPNVNIVPKNGIVMRDDKGKQPKDSTWVRYAPTKEAEFGLECASEAFMDAKQSFTEASTSGSKDKLELDMDSSMLKTFLETYMKLLCDSKAMKWIQELINRCTRTMLGEPRII